MSDRYIVARVVTDEWDGIHLASHEPLVDLPDADDTHLHRNPDGTWTAVAMVGARTVAWHEPGDLLVYAPGGAVWRTPWVDAPEEET